MKSLTNQHWTSLSGEPITGRIPPTLRIMNGVEPTPPQMGEIAHHYKLMTLALKVSIIPYMVQERTLVDGTRVRMVSSYGVDTVMAWPAGGKKNSFELPHGFVVATPYSVPRIYMRNKATNTWSFSDKFVPQAENGIVSTNQVYQTVQDRLPAIMPMVLGDDKFLWDWAAHKTEAGGSGPTPINLEVQKPGAAKRAFHPTHFAVGGKVVDSKGAVLFRMEDVLPTWDPEGESDLIHLPATTDGVGKQLLLQTYREKQWFSTDYYDIQHQHEILKRIGAAEYTWADGHYTESFRVPAWAPTTEAVNRSGSDLDTDKAPTDRISVRKIYATDPLLGPDVGTFVVVAGPYWAPVDVRTYYGVVGYTNTPVDSYTASDMNGYFYERENDGVGDYREICVATLPDHGAFARAVLTNKVFYRSYEYMRGGSASASTIVDSIPLTYGVHGVWIDRRDSEYSRVGSPALTLTADGGGLSEWLNEYRLFEGVVHGSLLGKYATDTETYENTKIRASPYSAMNAVLAGDSQPSWTPKDEITHYGQTGTFHLDYEAEVLSRNKSAEIAEILSRPSGTSTVLEVRNHPTMRGEYILTSRFIIDFDSRARFLAAIAVEVVCTGAQWDQNMDSSYPGALKVTTDPAYAVTIRFESDWNGTTDSKVLATGACTRPAFEFSTIRRENPYIYPVYDPTKDLIIRMPPDISPAPESYHQIKNLVGGQGTNTHLAAADVIPPLTIDGKSDQSDKGIEFSSMKNGEEVPHRKYVTGQLYVRQFKLSDFHDALWLLHSTACDAPENNFYGPPDGSDPRPPWFYMPELGETIKSEVFRIEMRDGQIVDWTDAIPAKPGSVKPAPNDRDIKLYRV